jgi:hypothetical protein
MTPAGRRLPGTQPLDMAEWLSVDDAYAAQMALRDRLIAERTAEVHALLPGAQAAAEELLAMVLPRLLPLGFQGNAERLTRPDGVTVKLDTAMALLTLGRLCQEDFCILQKTGGDEHVLTGAILCFPAGWMLSEKIGRPLMRIHVPVESYDAGIGQRVQRMFDMLRPDTPLWRANAHFSAAPLHNPRPEGVPRIAATGAQPWIRSERQSILRLPASGALVFSIHTWVVPVGALTREQRDGLAEYPMHAAF